jgi:hypothetical protein
MLAPRWLVASRLIVSAGSGPQRHRLGMKHIFLPMLAAALASPALAAPSGPSQHPSAIRGEEVSIPLPSFRLRNFRTDDPDVVFLEDRARNWYRAEVIGPCTDLPFAHAIGIDTRGSSSFDRFSAIVVGGDRCPLLSLTRSEKPQKKAKKRRV